MVHVDVITVLKQSNEKQQKAQGAQETNTFHFQSVQIHHALTKTPKH